MNNANHFDVVIIGGGLAGLVSAILLARAGKKVVLLEKHSYPHHKVCGEYVSNEVLGFLQDLGFNPFNFGAANITRLRLSSPIGKNYHVPLDLGAFSLSRFVMDKALADVAIAAGVQILTATRANEIVFTDQRFFVTTQNAAVYESTFVIGSWGKRETLDKKLNRAFMEERTGYLGLKYHIKTDYPINEIGLDNYAGGYCGISKIEGDRYNMCHFYRRPSGKAGQISIKEFEETVVFKNPILKKRYAESDFLLDAPLVINQFSFAPKCAVEGHIFMCGDSAGLIPPLCGNGMSMAITGAKILVELMLLSGLIGSKKSINEGLREKLEKEYLSAWSKEFSIRLFWGRNIQKVFGHPTLTSLALAAMHALPPLERRLISATHGTPII